MSSHYSGSKDVKRRGLGFHYVILMLAIGGHALSTWLGLSTGKIVLGLVVVGYIPGALAIRLLFRSAGELDIFEQVVLSIVSSLLLCASLGLLLNLLPKGLSPSFIHPAIWGLSVFLFLLNLWGDKHRASCAIPIKHRFAHLVGWATSQYPRHKLIAYSIAGVAAALCLILLVLLVRSAENDERFTEFYLLGPEGLAENYPREASVGQTLTVTVGIANQEAVPVDYQVYVISDELLIGESGPVHLEPGATDERPLSFTPLAAGDDVEVSFFLYREGVEGPYRSLRLWLKVTETG